MCPLIFLLYFMPAVAFSLPSMFWILAECGWMTWIIINQIARTQVNTNRCLAGFNIKKKKTISYNFLYFQCELFNSGFVFLILLIHPTVSQKLCCCMHVNFSFEDYTTWKQISVLTLLRPHWYLTLAANLVFFGLFHSC